MVSVALGIVSAAPVLYPKMIFLGTQTLISGPMQSGNQVATFPLTGIVWKLAIRFTFTDLGDNCTCSQDVNSTSFFKRGCKKVALNGSPCSSSSDTNIPARADALKVTVMPPSSGRLVSGDQSSVGSFPNNRWQLTYNQLTGQYINKNGQAIKPYSKRGSGNWSISLLNSLTGPGYSKGRWANIMVTIVYAQLPVPAPLRVMSLDLGSHTLDGFLGVHPEVVRTFQLSATVAQLGISFTFQNTGDGCRCLAYSDDINNPDVIMMAYSNCHNESRNGVLCSEPEDDWDMEAQPVALKVTLTSPSGKKAWVGSDNSFDGGHYPWTLIQDPQTHEWTNTGGQILRPSSIQGTGNWSISLSNGRWFPGYSQGRWQNIALKIFYVPL